MSESILEFQIIHQNVEYMLIVFTEENTLKIVMESQEEGCYWRGAFDKKYIEDITTKAGSYKTFHLFIKILYSALKKESNSVFFDILNYKDLEELRTKNQSNINNLSQSQSMLDSQKLNKKYLIISYTNEFENVHFPLPLNILENPDSSILIRTIDRLKMKIKSKSNVYSFHPNNSTNNEIELIKEDNLSLRNKIRQLESVIDKKTNFEYEKKSNNSNFNYEIENIKFEYENKIKLLVKTVEDLKKRQSYTSKDSNSQNKIVLDQITNVYQ